LGQLPAEDVDAALAGKDSGGENPNPNASAKPKPKPTVKVSCETKNHRMGAFNRFEVTTFPSGDVNVYCKVWNTMGTVREGQNTHVAGTDGAKKAVCVDASGMYYRIRANGDFYVTMYEFTEDWRVFASDECERTEITDSGSSVLDSE